MKTSLRTLATLLCLVLCAPVSHVLAQCTPDTSACSPPNPGTIANAFCFSPNVTTGTVGTPLNQTVFLNLSQTIDDPTLLPFPITIIGASFTSSANVPAGLNLTFGGFNAPTGTRGPAGCFVISGTPTAATQLTDSVSITIEVDAGIAQQSITINYKVDISPGSGPTCSAGNFIASCNGTLSDGSGSGNYSDNLDCDWLIQPNNASSIDLNFTSFATEAGADSLYIHDGTDATAPVLGSFSGSSLPSNLSSTGGAVFIRFVTNGSTNDDGWELEYACNIPGGCTPSATACTPPNPGTPFNFSCFSPQPTTGTVGTPLNQAVSLVFSQDVSFGGTTLALNNVTINSFIDVPPGLTVVDNAIQPATPFSGPYTCFNIVGTPTQPTGPTDSIGIVVSISYGGLTAQETLRYDIDISPATTAFDINAQATAVSCNGLADGSIGINTFNGLPPFQFSIDSGQTYQADSLFDNLPPGEYDVVAQDGNGNTSPYYSVTVTEPDTLGLSFATTAASCNQNDGEIDLTVTGGTPPYTYSWQPGGSISEDLVNLAAGTYTVVVTDSSGCTKTDSATVPSPNVPQAPTATGDTICQGENALLSATNVNGTGVVSWYTTPQGGAAVATGNAYTTPPLNGNQTFYVGVEDGGCLSQLTPVEAVVDAPVTAGILPQDTTIQNGGAPFTLVLNFSGSNATAYSWVVDGAAAGTGADTLQFFGPQLSGQVDTFMVMVIAENEGCGPDTGFAQVVHEETIGFAEPLPNNLELTTAPNPNAGNFRVSFATPVQGPYVVRLYSLEGRLVEQHQLKANGSKRTLHFRGHSTGTYLLQVAGPGGHSGAARIVVR